MSWLSNLALPKLQTFMAKKDVPENLWDKCPNCGHMLYHKELEADHRVCRHCGHHMRLSVKRRLALLFDDGEYEDMPLPDVPVDPLKFRDRRRYSDRLRDAQQRTERKDAIIVARGTMGGFKMVVAAFDFSFMGGSMGSGVGEALVMASDLAVEDRAALITIPASGGARMQESMLSLMQMPRTVLVADQMREARLPYIVLLTDPTTGGVTASFAMLGDIHVAEPEAVIGFAGRRVIEETIREQLPPNFQQAEYLMEHGMIDMVVPRSQLKTTLVQLLGLLQRPRLNPAMPLLSSPTEALDLEEHEVGPEVADAEGTEQGAGGETPDSAGPEGKTAQPAE